MIRYEIKKILGRTSSKIALLLLAILVVSFCYSTTHDESISWYNEQNQTDTVGYSSARKLREAQKEWAGVLDEEMLQNVLTFLKQTNSDEEKQGASHIRRLLNRYYQKSYQYQYMYYYNAENVQVDQLPQFYDNRVVLLEEWLYDESNAYNNGFYTYSDKEKEYLINRMDSLDTPIQVDWFMGWQQASRAASSIALFGIIILGYLLSGIFSNEARWKADSIYYSTIHGRRKGSIAKIKAGLLLTSIFVLTYLGADGANCPIQAYYKYWFSIYHLTFVQRYLLIIVTGYLGWIFVASLVMFLSAKSGSAALPVVVPPLLIITPMALSGEISNTKILELLPHQLFNLFGNMQSLTVYSVVGKVMTPVPLVLILYTCLTVFFAWFSYREYRYKLIK